jgi:hypothetical protein
MASGSNSVLSSAKAVNNTPVQTPPPSQPAQVGSASNEQQRRYGSGLGYSNGSASSSRASVASPRNNQMSRKPHRNHRKAASNAMEVDAIEQQVNTLAKGIFVL